VANASGDSRSRSTRRRSRRASAQAALDGFFATLGLAPARALIADYDGTLAPFRAGRRLVEPYPGVAEAVADIVSEGGTRLVIVSGRPLRDLEARAKWLDPLPELWGSHGLERRTPQGESSAPPVPLPLSDLLDEVERWIEERGWSDVFERKPFGFALHERPDAARYAEALPGLLEWWNSTLLQRGLESLRFDGGLEFRPAGTDKGEVVEKLFEELPAESAVAYLGDDLTDEDAFRSLRGRGFGVLVRDRYRPTEADVWLRPPEDLIDFLARWARTARAANEMRTDAVETAR